MKRPLLVLGAVLLAAAPAAHAAPATVDALLPSCKGFIYNTESGRNVNMGEAYNAALCARYAAGFADALELAAGASPLSHEMACPTSGVTLLSLVKTFVTWAERNPSHTLRSVPEGFIAAWRESYPCGGMGAAQPVPPQPAHQPLQLMPAGQNQAAPTPVEPPQPPAAAITKPASIIAPRLFWEGSQLPRRDTSDTE